MRKWNTIRGLENSITFPKEVLMRKEVWILVLAIALGVSLTLGSLSLFATKSELEMVQVCDKCGQVEYQRDKVVGEMWRIEDRYRDSRGVTGRMSPNDARRYRELQKQMQLWEEWQRKLGCQPGKVG
jgi:hypothetical protein